jgi:PadR family transcriptional regulator, regulatory protein PadR
MSRLLTALAFDANNVDIVANPLGEFEVLMLLGVLRLGDDAIPSAVRMEIELRAKRPVQRGAIYVTLDRLEAKGLLTSRATEADGSGARPRRAYRVTPRGLRALRRALREVERMRAGLKSLLLEPE